MELDPERRRELEDAGPRLGRSLIVAIIVGALAFLGLVVWILRLGGGIWG